MSDRAAHTDNTSVLRAAAPYPPVDGTQPCAGKDPEAFFPETSRTSHFTTPRAIAACERCPFKRPCLAYALTHLVWGIWGGTTRTQREQLRKKHHITAVPVVAEDDPPTHELVELEDRGGGLPQLKSPSVPV